MSIIQNNYRADIDGLRALAVISVIIFHISPALLTGGFLGVDIFFVISGYLITRILIKDVLRNKKIDWLGFYKRRVLRIFPALISIVIVTLIASYFVLTPDDFLHLSASAFASLFSMANIFFYMFVDTGYFAADTTELPLLHLWSLGVEEQFYIIWPFIVFALLTFLVKRHYILATIVVISLLSLSAAQILLFSDFSLSYYMLPTRAWELMFGGWLAFWLIDGNKINFKVANTLYLLGLLMVVMSLFFLDEHDFIPGIGALPAVLGATLMIAGGQSSENILKNIMCHKWVVAIGLISYSAYLIHWPILALLKYSLHEITLLTGTLVFILVIVLAQMNYRYVETPFRKSSLSNKKVFSYYFFIPVGVLASLCLIIIFSIKMQLNYIYPWDKYNLVTDTQPAYKYSYNCQYSQFNLTEFTESRCVFPEESKANVLLVGDSNAAHFVGMVREFSINQDIPFRNATQSSCPALLTTKNLPWVDRRFQEACQRYRSVLIESVSLYDTIIVAGDWTDYDYLAKDEFRGLFRASITRMAKQVSRVVIIGKIPTFKNYSINCEKRSLKLGLSCDSSRFNTAEELQKYDVNEFIKSFTEELNNVEYFDISTAVCTAGTCSPFIGTTPVYYDSGHLSMMGSHKVGTTIISNNLVSFPLIKK